MSQATTATTLTAPTGQSVRVQPLAQTDDGARITVSIERGPTWRVLVPDDGGVDDYRVLVSRDNSGRLADVETPGWLAEVLRQVA